MARSGPFRAAITMAIGLAGCASVPKGVQPMSGQHPQEFEKSFTKTLRCRYLLYLPDDYATPPHDRKWPLILFLHGAGERGDDLELVKKHGPPRLIAQGRRFPFIIVSPQCPAGRWWSPELLSFLLDDLAARYRVDPDRIYLTGLSMGGVGTWETALTYPDRFAAIAPVCGIGRSFLADRIRHVPAWVFHGAKDTVIPVDESTRMADALSKCGGEVKLTIYPDAAHDAWTETYNNPELYEWFLKHRRNGPPTGGHGR